jgi:hypothetical protein
MTEYKATPEQWAQCEEWLENPVIGASDACILELRDRVEALEAAIKQWRIDHLRLANTCAAMAPDRLKFFGSLLPDDEQLQPTFNPSQIRSSLVERVEGVLTESIKDQRTKARAAIREVAAAARAKDSQHWDSSSVVQIITWEMVAQWLEQEAGPTFSQEN